MSFLHSHSCECMKTELDLFTLPPTQTSIESSQWVHYSPISSLTDDAPLEFVVPGHGEDYLDLAHTMLSIRFQILPYAVADKGKVAPVNNILHSMFNQIDVFLNQKLVSPPNNAYPYRAYIETLLNYGSDAKKGHLTGTLWNDDTSGFMDATPDSGNNTGLKERGQITDEGKTVDLIGHLHCDVFNQDRFLINGVEMRVRMVRNKDAFSLMDNTGDGKCYIHLLESSLLVRRAKISPGVILAHANTLTKTTAKYPLTRVEVKSFTMHSGIHGDTLDNVVLGQLPKRVIIGFVDNRAFNGNRKLNPFNFQNFSINYLSLYVDGIQIPTKPLQPSFKNESSYINAYQTLFTGTGIHFSNESHGISRNSYPNGYCLFAFDLTPDLTAHCVGHWNLIKHGSIRVEIRFSDELTRTINCIFYSEYDNVLEIDANRQVITDFNS